MGSHPRIKVIEKKMSEVIQVNVPFFYFAEIQKLPCYQKKMSEDIQINVPFFYFADLQKITKYISRPVR